MDVDLNAQASELDIAYEWNRAGKIKNKKKNCIWLFLPKVLQKYSKINEEYLKDARKKSTSQI